MAAAEVDAYGAWEADADGATDSEAPAEVEADGSIETVGAGVGAGVVVSSPPFPASRPNSRIAAKITTVPITKNREALSVTRTASSDWVGAR